MLMLKVGVFGQRQMGGGIALYCRIPLKQKMEHEKEAQLHRRFGFRVRQAYDKTLELSVIIVANLTEPGVTRGMLHSRKP